MAWIASPPIDWGGDAPQALAEPFPLYSQDVKSHVTLTNIIAAVPTFFQIEVDETAAYPIAG